MNAGHENKKIKRCLCQKAAHNQGFEERRAAVPKSKWEQVPICSGGNDAGTI